MKSAIKAVLEDNQSSREAAMRYRIPRSTLARRVKMILDGEEVTLKPYLTMNRTPPERSMAMAVNAVVKRKVTIKRAALAYGVPSGSLVAQIHLFMATKRSSRSLHPQHGRGASKDPLSIELASTEELKD